MPLPVGQWELLLLVAVLVLLFGTSRIPSIGRKLGRGVKEYRDTIEQVDPRRPLREAGVAGALTQVNPRARDARSSGRSHGRHRDAPMWAEPARRAVCPSRIFVTRKERP